MTLRPDVHERRQRIRALGVIHLIGVREGERLDVDDHRAPARLRDDAGAVVDPILARGHEQHVETGLVAGVHGVGGRRLLVFLVRVGCFDPTT